MYQPWTPTMLKAHHDARLAEVENHPHWQVVRPRGAGLYERLLLHMGEFLVNAGRGLQARYEPGRHPGPDACPSAAGKASA